MLYAGAQFKLDKRVGDSKESLRDHLTAAWKMSGVMPPQLAEAPPLPELGAHIWRYFWDLSRFRGSNGFGPNRLTPTMIRDWCWLTGNKLDLWETRAIALIDEAYLKEND